MARRLATGDDEFATGERDLRVLRGFDLTIETPPLQTVARIEGAGGISLGDAYAAALAAQRDATLVVGADPEFGTVPLAREARTSVTLPFGATRRWTRSCVSRCRIGRPTESFFLAAEYLIHTHD